MNSQISVPLINSPPKKKAVWCQVRLGALRSIEEAIETTPLTQTQKSILQLRFLSLLYEYRNRSIYYSYYFNTLRIIISVGSLIVPALLSVQYTPANTEGQTNVEMYWVVWTLSLMVTISNAVISLLKVDKKYYTLNTTYQHLLSEGWQYIELSGKYSGFYTPSEIPTYENQFIHFCNILEKIRIRNVQDEFYKVEDHSHAAKIDPLAPPTPLKPLPFADAIEKSELSVNGGEGEVPSTTVRKQNTTPASASASAKASAAATIPFEESRVYELP
jgi:hypothetical protein